MGIKVPFDRQRTLTAVHTDIACSSYVLHVRCRNIQCLPPLTVLTATDTDCRGGWLASCSFPSRQQHLRRVDGRSSHFPLPSSRTSAKQRNATSMKIWSQRTWSNQHSSQSAILEVRVSIRNLAPSLLSGLCPSITTVHRRLNLAVSSMSSSTPASHRDFFLQLRTSDQTAGTTNQSNQWRGFSPDVAD